MQILRSLLESQRVCIQRSPNNSIIESLDKGNDKDDNNNDDHDNHVNLLMSALSVAQRRVVVKSPIHVAPFGYAILVDTGVVVPVPKPSFDIRGTVSRFDVYMTKS
jgi:hypothetical protein